MIEVTHEQYYTILWMVFNVGWFFISKQFLGISELEANERNGNY